MSSLSSSNPLETPIQEIPVQIHENPSKEQTHELSRDQEITDKQVDREEQAQEHGDDDGEEEEEEGECPFCLFMKGGGCKDTFEEWEKCVEEGERVNEDIVEKCFQATSALKKCMEAHSDYYKPLLQAEEELAKKVDEEDKEKEKLSSDNDQGKSES